MGVQLLVGGDGTCPGVHTPICGDRGGLAESEKPTFPTPMLGLGLLLIRAG